MAYVQRLKSFRKLLDYDRNSYTIRWIVEKRRKMRNREDNKKMNGDTSAGRARVLCVCVYLEGRPRPQGNSEMFQQ